MVQVQLRVSEEVIKDVDELVEKGKFKSRSDAIKSMILIYQEREKTRQFYSMLKERSENVKEEGLIPFE